MPQQEGPCLPTVIFFKLDNLQIGRNTAAACACSIYVLICRRKQNDTAGRSLVSSNNTLLMRHVVIFARIASSCAKSVQHQAVEFAQAYEAKRGPLKPLYMRARQGKLSQCSGLGLGMRTCHICQVTHKRLGPLVEAFIFYAEMRQRAFPSEYPHDHCKSCAQLIHVAIKLVKAKVPQGDPSVLGLESGQCCAIIVPIFGKRTKIQLTGLPRPLQHPHITCTHRRLWHKV